ncbi:MAG: hypothetical protein Q8J69_07810 [Sphingobacteriaceae bacterium]|nr:hypothetical protein [Sphingobacteriaceae bacterium]
MALSIVSQPPALAPVRQPLRLVLQTDNYQLTAGTKAVLRINISSAANGNSFTITIANKVYTFTARTSPDANSAFEFATNADTELLVVNIVAMFNSNPFFADNYNVTFNAFPFWVQLEAKQVGVVFTMLFNSAVGAFRQASNTAGVNATFRPSFKVMLYLTIGGVTVLKDARVDALNRCEFILEELLDNFLSVVAPNMDSATVHFEMVPVLNYALGYAESYGSDPVVQKRTTISRKVLPGLFDKQAMPAAALAPYISNTSARRYWSSKPKALLVKPAEMVLFAVYNPYANALVDWEIKYIIKREDGFLSNPISDGGGFDELSGEGIYCLYTCVAFILENYALTPDDVYSIEFALRITQTGSPANVYTTEYITLQLDHSEPQNQSILLFKAANGLFELAYFEGDTESQVQTTRSFADHLLPANYTADQGQIREVEVTRQKRYLLHSGFKKRDYIEWLQELAGSPEVYLMAPNLATKTRVNVVAHTDDLSSTNQELHFMQVTIQEAFIDRL